MKKFKFSFTGRQAGAIGKMYKETYTTHAETQEQAIVNLYKKFDHVTQLKCNGKLVNNNL